MNLFFYLQCKNIFCRLSSMITGEEVLFPVRVRSQERGSTLQQREVSLPAEFQPISSQPVLTISRDSLNNSVFEAELDKRLDKLVGISD